MFLDIQKIHSDFPILSQKINGKPLIYFDNAATTQKPQVMIDELVRFYSYDNANIHRGVHTLSQRATEAYEETRKYISGMYGCDYEEIIFTKSDTESLNLLAHSLGKLILTNNSNVVLTETEHHSNIVPWQLNISKIQENISLRYIEFDENGIISLEDLRRKVDRNTKIVSFTWASNTFGIINNAEEIIKEIKKINHEAIIIIDAAQSVPHLTFDFKSLGADFITFSAHKLCGPTGVGILIGKKELLERMPPFLGGGDMIREVTIEQTTYADLPYKFEAGTPNIADVIAFKKSLEYLNGIGFGNIQRYESELTKYLFEKLNKLDFIEIYGPKLSINNVQSSIIKLPLVSFNVRNVHAHDVGTLLDEDGIAVRTGHHCTQLIMRKLQIPASVRASLYIYNTKEEIDSMVESLKKVYDIFK